MAGREDELTRGYLKAMSDIILLVKSGTSLDKSNVMDYAMELIEEQKAKGRK